MTRINPVSARAENLPVTRKMLYLIRDELKSDIRALDSKIGSTDARMDSMESRLNSRMDSMEHRLSSQISRIELLVEEQNANNKLVLEGLSGLFERQDKIEARLP